MQALLVDGLCHLSTCCEQGRMQIAQAIFEGLQELNCSIAAGDPVRRLTTFSERASEVEFVLKRDYAGGEKALSDLQSCTGSQV